MLRFWPFHRNDDSAPDADAPQPPVPLTSMLRCLARRDDRDEGFYIISPAFSPDLMEYFTAAEVREGETLWLKIVIGARALDVRAEVVNVDESRKLRTGFRPQLRLMGLGPADRQLLTNYIDRFRRHIA